MTVNRTVTAAAVILVTASAAGPAGAAMMAYEFEGVISIVVDDYNQLGGSVKPGDPFSGRYVFDTETPDLDPDVYWGTYISPAASMSLIAGQMSMAASGSSCNVTVQDSPTSSDQLSFAGTYFTSGEYYIYEMEVLLHSSLPDTLQGDGLPTGPLALSAFDRHFLGVRGDAGDLLKSYKFYGTLTRFAVVPEPSLGIPALLVALVLVNIRCNRQRGFCPSE